MVFVRLTSKRQRDNSPHHHVMAKRFIGVYYSIQFRMLISFDTSNPLYRTQMFYRILDTFLSYFQVYLFYHNPIDLSESQRGTQSHTLGI
jgi:hypothetical protein